MQRHGTALGPQQLIPEGSSCGTEIFAISLKLLQYLWYSEIPGVVKGP